MFVPTHKNAEPGSDDLELQRLADEAAREIFLTLKGRVKKENE